MIVTNYTPEQTEAILKAYKEAPNQTTVETLAQTFGKTVRSIISKLSKEKVYVSPAKAGTAKRTMLKAEMVSEIAGLLEMNEDQLESLEKATGPALMAVMEGLRKSKLEASAE